jgi:type IV pilus assembly protein PilZ
VWTDPKDRAAFEGVVETLMSESLGPLVTGRLLRK